MPGFFSDTELEKIGNDRADVQQRFERLQDKLLTHTFKSPRALEYARQGLGRRLDEMSRSIHFIFELLPPEQESIPERDERIAATMLLQSYFINVQGCLDNIAWIWVYETDQRASDGSELRRGMVGLGKDYRYLMKSFSSSFSAHIRGLKKWMQHVAEFRDSTAHRIPLYIPPYVIAKKDSAEYERLSREAVAAYQRGDKFAYYKLRRDQDALGKYRPWMSHSPVESSPNCVFHKQIIQDFTTIDEITQKLFVELGNFKPTSQTTWSGAIVEFVASLFRRVWPRGD
jgi:hypothetical protein